MSAFLSCAIRTEGSIKKKKEIPVGKRCNHSVWLKSVKVLHLFANSYRAPTQMQRSPTQQMLKNNPRQNGMRREKLILVPKISNIKCIHVT